MVRLAHEARSGQVPREAALILLAKSKDGLAFRRMVAMARFEIMLLPTANRLSSPTWQDRDYEAISL